MSEPEQQGQQGTGSGSTPTQIEIQTEETPESPYRNMWVPLLVVPALIAMVLVLVASFFQLLSTEQKTPQQNLELLLNGGINERQQASFELVRQILQYEHATREGGEVEWGIDASFLEVLRSRRAAIPAPEHAKDVWVPFVLSSLMAQLGDAEGVRQLVEVTRLSEEFDAKATFRTNAIFMLGSIGGELGEVERLLVAERMIAIVAEPDDGMALLAAGALQKLPSPGTQRALYGLLGNRRADMRLQAALSLTELGDAAGAMVLLELLALDVYEKELAEDLKTKTQREGKRWSRSETVSATRLKVLDALAKLGKLPSQAELRALAEADSDPNFRSKILTLLAAPASAGTE